MKLLVSYFFIVLSLAGPTLACIETFKAGRLPDGYPSQEVVDQELFDLANQHPEYVQVFSIGKSVEGRPVYGLKISDNPKINEAEPEVSIIGGVHGDEIVGREIIVSFAKDLLSLKDQEEIKSTLESLEIFLLPCANPDGCDKNLRTNSQGIDLNREFPDFTTSDNVNTTFGRAQEVQNLMNFEESRDIALSLVYHGGEVPTVNYPWDTTGDMFPLEGIARNIALSYAEINPAMRNNSRFPGGVSNGYDWYTIDGGMQDWAYHYHDNLQLTVEVTLLERPSFHLMMRHYLDNRNSLFNFIKHAYRGAGIKDMPHRKEGSVKVFSLRDGEKSLISTAQYYGSGSFYKILPAGKYQIEVDLGKELKKSFPVEVKFDQYLSQDLFISWGSDEN